MLGDVSALGTRQLAGTDLEVSALGLGCAKIGGIFSGMSSKEAIRFLRAAHEAGITLFDTADIYGQGESERLLGEAFRASRDQVVLVSKAGYLLPRRKSLVQRVKPMVKPALSAIGLSRARLSGNVGGGLAGQSFTSDYLVAAAERSLRQIGTDYLDLLLLHSPSAEVLVSGCFLEAAESLKKRGVIRWFGVSCELPADAALAAQWKQVSCVEVPLSLLHPEAAALSLPRLRASKRGTISRQCLAAGLLTRTTNDDRADGNVPANRRVGVERCARAARSIGRTLPAAALGFSIATPGVDSTLVGSHTFEQLREAIAWAVEPSLSAQEYEFLLAEAGTGA
jgi:aryl-alcohol dehydrogenase-like predicted oxidoreductase